MAETEVLPGEATEREELPQPDLSVVVTLLNEAATLDELYERSAAALFPAGPPAV